MRTRTAPSAEPARPQLATRVDPQGNTIQTCRPSGVWRRRLPTASAIMISATAHVHVGPNLGSIWAYRPTCALCPFPLSWGLSRCACTFTVVFSCLWCLSCIMDRADGVMCIRPGQPAREVPERPAHKQRGHSCPRVGASIAYVRPTHVQGHTCMAAQPQRPRARRAFGWG